LCVLLFVLLAILLRKSISAYIVKIVGVMLL